MEIQIALAGSAILYHLIQMEYAIDALKHDRFRLAPTNESVEAQFGKGQYFLSLARSKHSDYFKKEIGSSHVVFVVDGQKLNMNYQIKPVDYWANQKYVNSDEKEDRLTADKMFIPCIRYVKEIHFMKESGKFKNNDSLSLALLAKRNKIELFQYDDMNAFANLDKRKVIKLEVSDKKKRKFGTKVHHEYTDGEMHAWYVASQIVFKPGIPFYTQFMKGARTATEKKARDMIARQIKELNRHTEVSGNAVRSLVTTMDHARSGDDLIYLEKMKRVKRRLRVDTRGFLDYVRKRWMTPEERTLHGLDAE